MCKCCSPRRVNEHKTCSFEHLVVPVTVTWAWHESTGEIFLFSTLSCFDWPPVTFSSSTALNWPERLRDLSCSHSRSYKTGKRIKSGSLVNSFTITVVVLTYTGHRLVVLTVIKLFDHCSVWLCSFIDVVCFLVSCSGLQNQIAFGDKKRIWSWKDLKIWLVCLEEEGWIP